MLSFKELDKLLDRAVSHHEPTDTFYAQMFPVLVQLKSEERLQLMQRLEGIASVDHRELGRLLLFKGMSSIFDGNYLQAIDLLSKAFPLFKEIGDYAGMMSTSCLLATSYRSIGQLEPAQKYIQEALNAIEFTAEEKALGYFNCICFYQAGELASQLKNYEEAIGFFKRGIRFIGENPEFEGRLLSGIGNVFMFTDQWEEAIIHFEKGLEVIKNSTNQLLLSKIYSDIGGFYIKKGDFEKALLNEKIGLEIRLRNNYINPSITSYIHLTEIYFGLGKLSEAIECGEKAVELASKLNVFIKLYEVYEILARIYEKDGNISRAYEYFKKYHQVQQEVLNQESIKKIEQIQNQYRVEKMQQEKEIIHLRNVELKAAMDEIHESIRYAKRIQNAILPSESSFKKYLPESFVVYLPKDIVAGDFYFLEKFSAGNETSVVLAACDCTGHGVPGALVSVICSNALNRTIHEYGITDPGKILDKTREMVISEFEKSDEEVKDGMDVSIACFQIKNGEISDFKWAGANNPLWIIRNEKLIEYKGNKQPVGKFLKSEHFTSHSIALEKGDQLYLFSDGFMDQFGGEKGKKFTAKKLSELLVSVSVLPLPEQKNKILEAFYQWQGNQEQVDDVMLIGIKV